MPTSRYITLHTNMSYAAPRLHSLRLTDSWDADGPSRIFTQSKTSAPLVRAALRAPVSAAAACGARVLIHSALTFDALWMARSVPSGRTHKARWHLRRDFAGAVCTSSIFPLRSVDRGVHTCGGTYLTSASC